MATQQSTVDFILDQASNAGDVSAKKMFGEYAVYCDGKVVALICNDQLYLKPTKAGRAFIETCEEEPPYPGAKPYLLISGDDWDEAEWLSTLIKVTAEELPLPKKRNK